MNIIQHADATRVSRITEYLHGDDAPDWTLWIAEPRVSIAYALADLGNAIARLGRKLCDDVPTVDDGMDWFAAGIRDGERTGRREAVKLFLANGGTVQS